MNNTRITRNNLQDWLHIVTVVMEECELPFSLSPFPRTDGTKWLLEIRHKRHHKWDCFICTCTQRPEEFAQCVLWVIHRLTLSGGIMTGHLWRGEGDRSCELESGDGLMYGKLLFLFREPPPLDRLSLSLGRFTSHFMAIKPSSPAFHPTGAQVDRS